MSADTANAADSAKATAALDIDKIIEKLLEVSAHRCCSDRPGNTNTTERQSKRRGGNLTTARERDAGRAKQGGDEWRTRSPCSRLLPVPRCRCRCPRSLRCHAVSDRVPSHSPLPPPRSGSWQA